VCLLRGTDWIFIYVPPGLTFTNSTFCPHSVFVCFVWISEQTAIISLYSINWLIFITETECVYCAVRTQSIRPTSHVINKTSCNLSKNLRFSQRWLRKGTALWDVYRRFIGCGYIGGNWRQQDPLKRRNTTTWVIHHIEDDSKVKPCQILTSSYYLDSPRVPT
jgi:hypothetical protein